LTHIWTLAKVRMRIATRSAAFVFFSMIFPLTFLFLYDVVFARGNPIAVTYLFGPVLALTVMGSFWGMSMQLVMFREQGILRRFRLAPVSAGAMLGSSIVSNFFLVLPTVVIEFLISRWIFKMPTFGNLWEIFALVGLGAATFSALGLIVASVTNDMQETQVINNVIWFAFLFISGATFPLAMLPGWLQKAALFLPATYLVTGLQGAMMKTIGIHEIAGDAAALAVGFVVAFEISRQLFRWEPEQKVPRRAKMWVVAALVPFLLLGVWENSRGTLLNKIQQNFHSMEQKSDPSAPLHQQ
jgi:ABC-2 type transport system permease protein